jgi:hypothetical protein
MYAATPAEIEQALTLVLAAAPDPSRRRALARPHDWDALAARMVSEIEARLAAA